MALLQDEIEITLNNTTVKYYEELGYSIPKHFDSRKRYRMPNNAKILVKVCDLQPGSGELVWMQCDDCGKQFHREWRYHKTYDGKIYCSCCVGKLRRGENAYNWNYTLSLEERIANRDYPEYNDFIKRVQLRDEYKCKICGKSHNIVVHHLNGFNWFVEGRTDDQNGITLCEECHASFHSIYGKGYNTKKQFEEWSGIYIDNLGIGTLPPMRQIICMDDGNIIDGAPKTAKQYNVERNSLYNVLNKKYRAIHGKHFLWYDEYESMTKDELFEYLRWILETKKEG